MKKKMLMIGVALAVLVTAFAYGCAKGVETYNRFDVSFEYPEGMEVIKEKGLIGFGEKASEEAGSLTMGKPGLVLEVFWMPAEDADRSHIGKVLGAYLAGRKEGHDFYLGDAIESTQNGHEVWGARFVTQGEEGIFLNAAGSWYCDRSNRVFTVSSGAEWEDPAFALTGSQMEPEWPHLNKDPSYKAYKEVMGSFRCHQ